MSAKAEMTEEVQVKLKAFNAFRAIVEDNTKRETIGKSGNQQREKKDTETLLIHLLGRTPTAEEKAFICLQ